MGFHVCRSCTPLPLIPPALAPALGQAAGAGQGRGILADGPERVAAAPDPHFVYPTLRSVRVAEGDTAVRWCGAPLAQCAPCHSSSRVRGRACPSPWSHPTRPKHDQSSDTPNLKRVRALSTTAAPCALRRWHVSFPADTHSQRSTVKLHGQRCHRRWQRRLPARRVGRVRRFAERVPCPGVHTGHLPRPRVGAMRRGDGGPVRPTVGRRAQPVLAAPAPPSPRVAEAPTLFHVTQGDGLPLLERCVHLCRAQLSLLTCWGGP